MKPEILDWVIMIWVHRDRTKQYCKQWAQVWVKGNTLNVAFTACESPVTRSLIGAHGDGKRRRGLWATAEAWGVIGEWGLMPTSDRERCKMKRKRGWVWRPKEHQFLNADQFLPAQHSPSSASSALLPCTCSHPAGQELHYPYQWLSTHSFYKEMKLQFQMPLEENGKKKGCNSQDCGPI